MKHYRSQLMLGIMGSLLILSACNNGGSSDHNNGGMTETPTPSTFSYQIEVTNLTYGQPMSPIAVILHDEGQFWQVGQSASLALETLAESGDNAMLLQDGAVLASQSGQGILMPGMTETISVSLTDNHPELFSLATMLVNTNDAFTGINAMSLTDLRVGESISVMTSSYDAGTEKNTEWMSTIPGPASGGTGEGFNEMRDDLDIVAMHPGVVTSDDGLPDSVLTQAHRFDNPTLKVTISRLE